MGSLNTMTPLNSMYLYLYPPPCFSNMSHHPISPCNYTCSLADMHTWWSLSYPLLIISPELTCKLSTAFRPLCRPIGGIFEGILANFQPNLTVLISDGSVLSMRVAM